MEETNKKKRGWVKDAAIIFLAVLLVLTFFSNTILNRSLPEVATVYVTEGQITSQVRGTGTVTARENYDVVLDRTRTVQSVLVRVGDEVSAGDVLFILQAGDSDELENAQKQLHSMELSYQRALINASSSDYARENRNISDAREALEEAEADRDDAVITDAELAEYNADHAALEADIAALEAEIKAQEAVVDARKADVQTENGNLRELELQLRALRDELAKKKAVVSEKQAVVDEKQVAVDEAQEKLNTAKQKRDEYSAQDPSYAPVTAAWNEVTSAEENLTNAQTQLEVARVLYGDAYDRLVQEATYLEYDYKMYHVADDTEARYRAERGMSGTAVLSAEQQAELAVRIASAKAALGSRADYSATELNVYLGVAAVKFAGTDMADAYSAISAAENSVSSAQTIRTQAYSAYERAYNTYYDSVAEDRQYAAYNRDVRAAQSALDEANKPLNAAKKDLAAANSDVDGVNADISELQETISRATSEELGDQQSFLQEAQELLTTLETRLSTAEGKLKTLEGDMEAREAEYKNKVAAVKNAQNTLEDLIFNLDQQKLSDNKSAQLTALDLQEQLLQIQEQRALVEELSGEDDGTEVKANVAGTVRSLSVSAGRKAEAGNVLATIEVPDLGYGMSFSVTTEQARRLRVGDTATVSNFYWGSQIVATLTSIQTDPQNPQGSRLLEFDLTGDVTAGNSLTISIGARNATYDMVVPNSAIRSDTNGSFVLMITAKNSPLGNRYYATRVNVEVLASDDQYSAINGAIESYDSVITTASRNTPISSGDQVRLADAN